MDLSNADEMHIRLDGACLIIVKKFGTAKVLRLTLLNIQSSDTKYF